MTVNIENYALIGDCETAALVGRDGSIDWLCWPRFDSGACFAAMLGTANNGRWRLGSARTGARVSRCYRERTLILETEIETEEGTALVVDFMPPRGVASDLVRLVQGKSGRVAMHSELSIRFDYGSRIPWLDRRDDGVWCFLAGPDMAVLRAPVALRGDHLKTTAEFTVAAGETFAFTLTYGPSHLAPSRPIDATAALAQTEAFWCGWASRARPAKEWSEPVVRSLITLKALIHRPTGGVVAAATTSLPEQPSGTRNWDYRYCWLRDGTFTLLTLMNAGFYEDARAWREWLLRTAAGDPGHIQVMYGVTGERRLPEWNVQWLGGFNAATPVRVGNAAFTQLQIDIYGEVMDVLYHSRVGKLGAAEAGWEMQLGLLENLETIWPKPDHGIWEMRGGTQHFTNSKVMAWVAFDRAVKTIEQFTLDGPLERWRAMRARIHDEVCRCAFNPEIGAFTQSYGSDKVDASTLLIPLVGFLPAQDSRVRWTIEAIQRELVVDGLVMRYDTRPQSDSPGEGAFLPCSFWLADCLILLGRREEARALFERLLSLRNDVGLLAEEYDVNAKCLVGNFPQALSHIALVNTGYELAAQRKHKHKRHETGAASAAVHPLAADAEL